MRKEITIDMPIETDTDINFPCGCRIWYHSMDYSPTVMTCSAHFGESFYARTTYASHELGFYLRKFKEKEGKDYSNLNTLEFMLFLKKLAKEQYPEYKEYRKQREERIQKMIAEYKGKK